MGADEQYADSQTFAVQALEAGFDGVRHLVRHDPAQKLHGLALFSRAAAPAPADPLWPGNSSAIPETLVRAAERRFGYRVLPTP